MKLLFLIGAQASGKMTVGRALEKITPLRLFHNHMTIEPVIDLFGGFNGTAISRLRQVVFEEFAKTDNYGLMFTYVWAFDQQADWDYVEQVSRIYREAGAEVDYVELIAPLSVRLERNRMESRLKEKPSKRDAAQDLPRFMYAENNYRCVSEPGEVPYERYLRIDNTNLSPEAAAELIVQHFGYERKAGQ